MVRPPHRQQTKRPPALVATWATPRRRRLCAEEEACLGRRAEADTDTTVPDDPSPAPEAVSPPSTEEPANDNGISEPVVEPSPPPAPSDNDYKFSKDSAHTSSATATYLTLAGILRTRKVSNAVLGVTKSARSGCGCSALRRAVCIRPARLPSRVTLGPDFVRIPGSLRIRASNRLRIYVDISRCMQHWLAMP